jgi:hypothetical protein
MGAMDLENCLCQINPNHHILHFAVLLFCVALNTTTLAHSDAVWGGRQPLHLAYNMRRLCQLRRINPCPA